MVKNKIVGSVIALASLLICAGMVNAQCPIGAGVGASYRSFSASSYNSGMNVNPFVDPGMGGYNGFGFSANVNPYVGNGFGFNTFNPFFNNHAFHGHGVGFHGGIRTRTVAHVNPFFGHSRTVTHVRGHH